MTEPDAGPDRPAPATIPLTVADVLKRLPCGRNWLLTHLRAWPMYRGRPTHRFAGRSIVFTAEDFRNLVESLPVRRSADGPLAPHDPHPPAPSPVPKSPGRRGKRTYMKPPKTPPPR